MLRATGEVELRHRLALHLPRETRVLVELVDQLRFDQSVLRCHVDGLSVRETAALLDCTRKMVEASRRWLRITSNRSCSDMGPRVGRLSTRVGVARLMAFAAEPDRDDA